MEFTGRPNQQPTGNDSKKVNDYGLNSKKQKITVDDTSKLVVDNPEKESYNVFASSQLINIYESRNVLPNNLGKVIFRKDIIWNLGT
ncbi:hypothetical protein ACJX0J_039901 [Zea mays]